MADKTLVLALPPTKTIDLGDGTYVIALYAIAEPAGLTDTTFRTVLPPLKAINNGDGTYNVATSIV